MDATTLLGLSGIGGTLLGTLAGAGGVLGAARITSRGQAEAEELKARRQVYSACATALLARQDAVFLLLETFTADSFDLAVVQAGVRDTDDQRATVARAVAAVAVEGPDEAAHRASIASKTVEHLCTRLRDWAAAVAVGRSVDELLHSQLTFAQRDQAEVEDAVDDFTRVCRTVLHPADRPPAARRLWRGTRGGGGMG
ncbi:hypothetical protein ACIG3E_32570 [Streptomyces sp. NPDC053474]|uniref:hypothetical protein n=1 Tax=Streptomyces sp. NPDC053474 TaxID=3365704 RepID=UPI0037D25C0F